MKTKKSGGANKLGSLSVSEATAAVTKDASRSLATHAFDNLRTLSASLRLGLSSSDLRTSALAQAAAVDPPVFLSQCDTYDIYPPFDTGTPAVPVVRNKLNSTWPDLPATYSHADKKNGNLSVGAGVGEYGPLFGHSANYPSDPDNIPLDRSWTGVSHSFESAALIQQIDLPQGRKARDAAVSVRVGIPEGPYARNGLNPYALRTKGGPFKTLWHGTVGVIGQLRVSVWDGEGTLSTAVFEFLNMLKLHFADDELGAYRSGLHTITLPNFAVRASGASVLVSASVVAYRLGNTSPGAPPEEQPAGWSCIDLSGKMSYVLPLQENVEVNSGMDRNGFDFSKFVVPITPQQGAPVVVQGIHVRVCDVTAKHGIPGLNP